MEISRGRQLVFSESLTKSCTATSMWNKRSATNVWFSKHHSHTRPLHQQNGLRVQARRVVHASVQGAPEDVPIHESTTCVCSGHRDGQLGLDLDLISCQPSFRFTTAAAAAEFATTDPTGQWWRCGINTSRIIWGFCYGYAVLPTWSGIKLEARAKKSRGIMDDHSSPFPRGVSAKDVDFFILYGRLTDRLLHC